VSASLLGVVLAACLLGAWVPWGAVRSSARLAGVGPAGVREVRRRRTGRRGRTRDRGGAAQLDVVVLLDLLDAAIAAGASLPRALGAVGRAVDEAAGVAADETLAGDGQVLVRAASALVMGADWHAAWQGAPARLGPVVDGLAPTWVTGAAPGPALRAAAEKVRRERRSAAREAAGRLGVRLVLPLGLCFLPAFILIGLVPVILSLAAGLLGSH